MDFSVPRSAELRWHRFVYKYMSLKSILEQKRRMEILLIFFQPFNFPGQSQSFLYFCLRWKSSNYFYFIFQLIPIQHKFAEISNQKHSCHYYRFLLRFWGDGYCVVNSKLLSFFFLHIFLELLLVFWNSNFLRFSHWSTYTCTHICVRHVLIGDNLLGLSLKIPDSSRL